jgi:hypothetical protein
MRTRRAIWCCTWAIGLMASGCGAAAGALSGAGSTVASNPTSGETGPISSAGDEAPIAYAPTDPNFPGPSGLDVSGTVDNISQNVLGGSPSLKVSVVSAPNGFDSNATWLQFAGDVGNGSPAIEIRDWWDAALIAGAVRDQMNADGAGDLGGFVLDNGNLDTSGVHGRGTTALHQHFTDNNSPDQIASDLTAKVKEAGLELESVSVLVPMQAAPVVKIVVADPKAFVASADSVLTNLFGDQGAYEGYYFEADDTSGSPVFITAHALRFGAGMSYYRPDVDPNPPPMIQAPPVS